MAEDGRLRFQVDVDVKTGEAKLTEFENKVKQMTRDVESEGGKLEKTFEKLGAGMAAFFSMQQAKQLVSQIASVRGEFQQLEVAFETMLQSGIKSEALMNQLVKTAATTPFGLQDVAGGAKQLLAYGFAAEEVNQTLIDLGNIAAGLSVPLNDLVYLYGTTKTQGRVYTQDMRQFMGRGIPLAEELAKQFKVTKDEVNALVTAGKIGFPEVEKAIKSMSGEGGKFFNLMEKQSHTITGLISNLEDAMDMMFNDIGEKSQDVIASALQMAISLVENYDKVGKAIAQIVAVLGTYKAATIAVSVAQKIAAETAKGYTLAQLAQYKALLAAEKAQGLLNKTMLKNPYVLAATAVAGLTIWLVKMARDTSEATKAMKDLEDIHNGLAKGSVAFDSAAMTELKTLEKLKDKLEAAAVGTTAWRMAKDEMVAQFGKYNSNLEAELTNVKNLQNVYANLKKEIADNAKVKGYNSFLSARTTAIQTELDSFVSTIDKKVTNAFNSRFNDAYNLSVQALKKQGVGAADVIQDIISHIYNGTNLKYTDFIAGFVNLNKQINKAREDAQTLVDLPNKVRTSFGLTLDQVNKDNDKYKAQTERQKKAVAEMEKIEAQIAVQRAKVNQGIMGIAGESTIEAQNAQKAALAKLQSLETQLKKKQEEYAKLPSEEKGTAVDPNDHSAEKSLAAAQKEAELEKRIAEKRIEIINNTTAKELEARKDSHEKTLAEMALAHKQELEALAKEEAETLKLLQEQEHEAWRKKNPKAKETAFVQTIKELPADIKKLYADLYAAVIEAYNVSVANAEEENRKSLQASMDAYYMEFGTYTEKREALIRSYTQKIAEATNEWEKKSLEAQRDRELQSLEMANSEVFKKIFGDPAKKTAQAIKEAIKLAENELKKLNKTANPESYKAIIDQIEKMREEQRSGWNDGWGLGGEGIFHTLTKLEDVRNDIIAELAQGEEMDVEKLDELYGEEERLSNSVKKSMATLAVGKFTDALGGVADALLEVAELADNPELADVAGVLKEVTSEFGSIANGFASGGVIGGVVTTLTSMFDKLVSTITEMSVMNAQFEASVASYNKAVTLLQFDRKYNDIFGANELIKAKDAMEDLAETERALQKINKGLFGNGIGNMYIQSGLMKESKLSEVYKGVVDEDGNLVIEKAKLVLKELEKIKRKTVNDELTIQWIKDAIEMADVYEKKLAEVDKYINNMFGNVGDDIADAILNGADAFDVLKDSSADFLETFTRDVIKAMLFTDEIKNEYSDRMRAALASGDESQIVSVLADLNEEVGSNIAQAQAYLEQVQRAAGQQGIDMARARSNAATGIAQASQDSVDELNGRFTAIQQHTANIQSNTRQLLDNSNNILRHVMGIHDNTANIESAVVSIKRDITDIKDRL